MIFRRCSFGFFFLKCKTVWSKHMQSHQTLTVQVWYPHRAKVVGPKRRGGLSRSLHRLAAESFFRSRWTQVGNLQKHKIEIGVQKEWGTWNKQMLEIPTPKAMQKQSKRQYKNTHQNRSKNLNTMGFWPKPVQASRAPRPVPPPPPVSVANLPEPEPGEASASPAHSGRHSSMKFWFFTRLETKNRNNQKQEKWCRTIRS